LATKVEEMKQEKADLLEELAARPAVEAKAQVANDELNASNERVCEAKEKEDEARQKLSVEERERALLNEEAEVCSQEVQAQEGMVWSTQQAIAESSNSLQKLTQSLHVLSQLLDTVGQAESMSNTALPGKAKVMVADGTCDSELLATTMREVQKDLEKMGELQEGVKTRKEKLRLKEDEVQTKQVWACIVRTYVPHIYHMFTTTYLPPHFYNTFTTTCLPQFCYQIIRRTQIAFSPFLLSSLSPVLPCSPVLIFLLLSYFPTLLPSYPLTLILFG
jgi:hypothetical protein